MTERDLAGRQLGDVELVAKIAEHPGSSVWRGRDTKLGRDVAVKIVELDRDLQVSEVDLVRRLEHPHIVRLYDFGVVDGEFTWMVLELVNGVSLADRISSGPISTTRPTCGRTPMRGCGR